MDDVACSHLDTIRVVELPDPVPGCEECLKIGSDWVHLRMCMACGHIGCCDESPNRHASGHFRSSDHPIMKSAEPGDGWSWCFVDQVGFELAE
jgi:hypothetical protein